MGRDDEMGTMACEPGSGQYPSVYASLAAALVMAIGPDGRRQNAEGARPRETPSRLTSAWCEAGVRWDVLTAVAVAVALAVAVAVDENVMV